MLHELTFEILSFSSKLVYLWVRVCAHLEWSSLLLLFHRDETEHTPLGIGAWHAPLGADGMTGEHNGGVMEGG